MQDLRQALRKPHLVFVEDLQNPKISEDDRHHLKNVLRVSRGEIINASDGRGSWRACTLEKIGSGREGGEGDDFEALKMVGEIIREDEPRQKISVAFALVKKSKASEIIARLTELGVSSISPFLAERSVVRVDDAKAALLRERWSQIIREAAMQSRQVYLPELKKLCSFQEALQDARESGYQAGLCVPDGQALTPDISCLFVGPEGGWSEREEAALKVKVRLNRNILRTETAAVAAATLLSSLRGGADVASI